MSESEKSSKKLYVTLPGGARALLDDLVSSKFYGETRTEVARHLIIVGLEALIRRGRLKDPLPPED
jgi:hypothetical protein